MKILAKIFCTVVCVVFVTQGGNAGERNDLNSSPFPAIMSLDSLGDTVYVDDDWASQADVDLFNIATGNDLVWDTTAFGSIPDAYTGVTERVIFIRPGAYLYQVHAIGLTNLTLIGSGVDSTIIRAPVTTMPDIYSVIKPPPMAE